MPKINAVTCYKSISLLSITATEEPVEIVVNKFISVWIETLKDPELKTRLEDNLNRHVGPNSTFTNKELLVSYLNLLVALLSDKTPLILSLEKKQCLIQDLEFQIDACSPGFFNRVQDLIVKLSVADSVDKLLLKIRNSIVDKVARKYSTLIHTHNIIFKLADFMGLHVTIPDAKDPYGPEHPIDIESVKQILHLSIASEYQSFDLLNQLIETIKHEMNLHFEYFGQIDSGYEYGYLQKFNHYFGNLFEHEGIPFDAYLQTKNAQDEDDLTVIDINWEKFSYDLLNFLYEKNYFHEEIAEEKIFLNHIISNNQDGLTPYVDAFFANKRHQSIAFFKFFKHICPQTQLTLLQSLFKQLTPSKQLNLAFELLLEFDNPATLQNMKTIDEQLHFTQLLIAEPELFEHFFCKPWNTKSILTMLGWLQIPLQEQLFKRTFSSGINPLMQLAKTKNNNCMEQALQLFEQFSDASKSIILTFTNKCHVDLLTTCILNPMPVLEQIFCLYEKAALFSDKLFRQTSFHGNNLLITCMRRSPQYTERLLIQLIQKSPETQIAVLLQSNKEKISCLSLALENDFILDKVVSLIGLQPPSIINLVLGQATNRENNILIDNLKNYPNQFEKIFPLIKKLDVQYQLQLIKKTDGGHANIFHLASVITNAHFEFLLNILFQFDEHTIYTLLKQQNDLDQDVLSELSLRDAEKFSNICHMLESNCPVLFKHLLSDSFSKILTNALNVSSGNCKRVLNLFSLFSTVKQQQYYIELYQQLGLIRDQGYQISILTKHCCQQLIASNENYPHLYSILIKLSKLSNQFFTESFCNFITEYPEGFEQIVKLIGQIPSHALINEWISKLESIQLEELYKYNPNLLLKYLEEQNFETLFSVSQSRLAPEVFIEICHQYDLTQNRNILGLAVKLESDGPIKMILSFEDGFIVSLFTQLRDNSILSTAFPHARLVIERFLQFSLENQHKVLIQDRFTIPRILKFINPDNEKVLQKIIDLRLVCCSDIKICDLQEALKLSSALFKSFLSAIADEDLKQIIFDDDTSPIFDNLDKDCVPENIFQLLKRLASLNLTKEEIESQINIENWWHLCCAPVDEKKHILSDFLELFSDKPSKIELFTATSTTQDNVFSLVLSSKQSIDPILSSFLSLTPDSIDIYKALKQVSTRYHSCSNIFFLCISTSNQKDSESLFAVITRHLSEIQQYHLFSCSTGKSHQNIFQNLFKYLPPMLPMVCQYLQLNENIRNKIFSDIRKDDLSFIDSISERYLTEFFQLLKMLPENILMPILFNTEQSDYNLLESVLDFKAHQTLVIDVIKSQPLTLINQIFGVRLLSLASYNPPHIFNEILEMLKGFAPESQFALIRRSDYFPISGIGENTISFLTYLRNMAPQYHLGLLASFDWAEIFEVSEEDCEIILQWLGNSSNDYKVILLSKDILADAVNTQNQTIINKILEIVQTLDIKEQNKLFIGFDEAIKLRYNFDSSHQVFIQQIRAIEASISKKREFGLFQPSESSSHSKEARPKLG